MERKNAKLNKGADNTVYNEAKIKLTVNRKLLTICANLARSIHLYSSSTLDGHNTPVTLLCDENQFRKLIEESGIQSIAQEVESVLYNTNTTFEDPDGIIKECGIIYSLIQNEDFMKILKKPEPQNTISGNAYQAALNYKKKMMESGEELKNYVVNHSKDETLIEELNEKVLELQNQLEQERNKNKQLELNLKQMESESSTLPTVQKEYTILREECEDLKKAICTFFFNRFKTQPILLKGCMRHIGENPELLQTLIDSYLKEKNLVNIKELREQQESKRQMVMPTLPSNILPKSNINIENIYGNPHRKFKKDQESQFESLQSIVPKDYDQYNRYQ